MGHKVISGKVITSPDADTPSGHNNRATEDAFSQYDVDPNVMAAKVFVTAEEWAEFVHAHGGEVAYGRQLGAEVDRLKRETGEVKLALIFMAARLIAADPASYRRGKGWNQTAIAEAVGIQAKTPTGKHTNRDLVGAIAKGAVGLVENGMPLYGEPAPEVVALAMEHANKIAERKKRANAKAKAPGQSAAEANSPAHEGDGTSVESEPLTVADLVKALEAAHQIIDGLADRESEEWADVNALVDSLSDKVYDA